MSEPTLAASLPLKQREKASKIPLYSSISVTAQHRSLAAPLTTTWSERDIQAAINAPLFGSHHDNLVFPDPNDTAISIFSVSSAEDEPDFAPTVGKRSSDRTLPQEFRILFLGQASSKDKETVVSKIANAIQDGLQEDFENSLLKFGANHVTTRDFTWQNESHGRADEAYYFICKSLGFDEAISSEGKAADSVKPTAKPESASVMGSIDLIVYFYHHCIPESSTSNAMSPSESIITTTSTNTATKTSVLFDQEYEDALESDMMVLWRAGKFGIPVLVLEARSIPIHDCKFLGLPGKCLFEPTLDPSPIHQIMSSRQYLEQLLHWFKVRTLKMELAGWDRIDECCYRRYLWTGVMELASFEVLDTWRLWWTLRDIWGMQRIHKQPIDNMQPSPRRRVWRVVFLLLVSVGLLLALQHPLPRSPVRFHWDNKHRRHDVGANLTWDAIPPLSSSVISSILASTASTASPKPHHDSDIQELQDNSLRFAHRPSLDLVHIVQHVQLSAMHLKHAARQYLFTLVRQMLLLVQVTQRQIREHGIALLTQWHKLWQSRPKRLRANRLPKELRASSEV
ncbi:hypothetical protein BZG36_05471 [Bifiguratus adelaidae]|uniref:Uncharacterized protein n=1 Tax=Bifiguratus adelaidae TaxID=1938954 RepID=A0A261XTB6_9FUNG|nr:hypothetical protein BZG36_05471 [Bifiguratus adelaidae]